MATVIAVVNSKGGVGKTTFAQNFLLPALGKAVFVDTDVYSRGIAFIKNSDHLIKYIKLKTVDDTGVMILSLDVVRVLDDIINVISKYENENIIIDIGSSVIADAVIRSGIIPAGIVNMVFIPTREQISDLDDNLNLIQQSKNRCVIVDIITHGNGQIYIPDIKNSLLEFVKEKGITLPEIVKFLDSSNPKEKALADEYKLYYKTKTNTIINNIKHTLQ